MILNIIFLIILIIWMMIYLKKKEIVKTLPYLIIIFITPFYSVLDQNLFVEIFGCGCVPIAQTNMFNIDFNANDLRLVVYTIISIIALFLGIKISKKIESKTNKIIYNLSIILFNLVLTMYICKIYMWA